MKVTISKFIIIVCLLFVSVLLFLMSPFFSISDITINGNKRFSDQDVLDMTGAGPGTNIFRFKYGDSRKRLGENTYIKYAEIETVLPNKLIIDIVEREICGYVPYLGTYLYIDQDGYVLENNLIADTVRPIVSGLDFKEFTVGEQLIVDNKSSFEVATVISRLLLNYNYLEHIREMDISDPENIRLYVDNIDISFGSISDADKKMRTIIEIIKNIPQGDKGVLHVEDINETPYFTYTS